MLANSTNSRLRLTTALQQLPMEITPGILALPGETEFPSPPALSNSLFRLDLWLSAFVADLKDTTNIIRGDIGLTSQLLRLAANGLEEAPGKIVAISDLVVLAGVEKLRTLVAATQSLSDRVRNHAAAFACERFWSHASLTAQVAQELVYQSCEVSPEEAYVAGLLCNLGELHTLLSWSSGDVKTQNSRQTGRRMAEAWRFPRDLVDVIGGDRNACRTGESRALLDIATDADNWASRLETLAAHESESARVKRARYRP